VCEGEEQQQQQLLQRAILLDFRFRTDRTIREQAEEEEEEEGGGEEGVRFCVAGPSSPSFCAWQPGF
jgi:hypothetical protein